MLNARTWHRLCLSAFVLFAVAFISQFFPHHSFFAWLSAIAIIGCFIAGICGAILGILLVRGKLSMGCPSCKAKSFVSGGNREPILLDCPNCGEMRLNLGRIGPLQTTTAKSEIDEWTKCKPTCKSPLHAPLLYRVPFAILFLPVVGSIVAASVIHQFSFFYLLIPGFWCYAVAGFMLEAIYAGYYNTRQGRIVRRKAPIRFWGVIGLWALFYLFATAFPIGYAKQESRKEKAQIEQISAPEP